MNALISLSQSVQEYKRITWDTQIAVCTCIETQQHLKYKAALIAPIA